MSNYYFSAIISTGDSIFGGTSLYFDGNDYIYTQGSKEFEFGFNNFSVEMWIRPDPYTPSMSTNNTYGILATTAAPTDFQGFLLGINPDYTLTCSVGSSTSWQHTITTSTSVSPNGWSHVAVTRESNTLGLYINGQLKTFKNIGGTTYLNNPNNQIQIGGRSLNNQYYKGYIDELRITTGISRYSVFDKSYEFYTNEDPFYPNTTLLIDYNNNQANDISVKNNQCIISGDAFVSDLKKFLGKPSLILGEQTGYMIINSGNQSFNFETGDFTIESWIHPINSPDLEYIPIIETRNDSSSTSSFTLGISKIANSYVLDFSPNGGIDNLYSNTPIQFNTWSFITLTRKNNIFNFYINGLKQNNSLTTSASLNCELESPIIGLSKDNSYFHGYINDFRITKLCRYTESFDYPKVSLFKENAEDPYYKNTSILLNMDLEAIGEDKILIDQSINNSPISGYGEFKILQTGYKFGNGCLEFGTGSANNETSGGFVTVPNSDVFNFENKDFTIEFWYKRKNSNIEGSADASNCCPGWYGRFFTTYCSGGGFNDIKNAMIDRGAINILMEKNSITGSVYFRNDNNPTFISGNLNMGEIPETWTYYTLMRKSGTIASFKNGELVDSINVGNKPIFNNFSGFRYSPTVNIGGTSEGFHSLNGYMDSFRITKGYARYPNMFTGFNYIQKNEFTTLSRIGEFYENELVNLNNNYENIVKPFSISQDGAGYFNQSGYLEIFKNSNFNFGTGNFTIEFWFKNLTSGNSGVIFQTSTGSSHPQSKIFLTGNNKLYSNFSFSGNSFDISLDMGAANSGEWGHYAVVRNTGSFFGYKNGINIDTKVNLLTPFNNEDIGDANIGGTGDYCIHGLVDEFRITKNFARYKEAFFPPKNIEKSPNEDKNFYKNILTIPFIETEKIIKDYSINSNNIKNVNNVKILNNIKFKKLISSAISRDNLLLYWNFKNNNITPEYQAQNYTIQQVGTTTFLSDGPSNSKAASLTVGNRIILRTNLWNNYTGPYTSFTCSMWVRKTASNNSGSQGIYMGSCFGPMGFWFSEIGGDFGPGFSLNNNIAMRIQTQNVSYNSVTAVYNNYPVPLNEWMHIVCVNDYESKIIRLYLNGNQVATAGYSTLGSYYSNWNGIALNGSVTASSSEYGGNYDFALLGLWNRKISNSEVKSLYNIPLILET